MTPTCYYVLYRKLLGNSFSVVGTYVGVPRDSIEDVHSVTYPPHEYLAKIRTCEDVDRVYEILLVQDLESKKNVNLNLHIFYSISSLLLYSYPGTRILKQS